MLQGCIVSPQLLKLFLHAIISLLENKIGLKISEISRDNLAYANYLAMIAEFVPTLQGQASELGYAANSFGKTINLKKTKNFHTARHSSPSPFYVIVSGKVVKSVTQFAHLGSLLELVSSSSNNTKKRLALGSKSFKRLLPLFKHKHLSIQLKLQLFDLLIVPVALYACET